MIITILAILLGLVTAVGGIAPNLANGLLQDRLNTALNQPKELRVKLHPVDPSFSLLSGSVAYTEIDASDFVVSDLPVQELNLRIDRLEVNTNDMQLREPSQGTVRVKISEAGLNKFLESDTFRQLLDNMRSRQELLSQLDADLQDLHIDLQGDRVQITGNAATMGGFFSVPFDISGQLRLNSERQLYVQAVDANTLGRPLASDMIQSILQQINPIVDLEKLSNDEMQFFFRQIQVFDDHIELFGEAKLKRIPQ